jgi:hypothetical protein
MWPGKTRRPRAGRAAARPSAQLEIEFGGEVAQRVELFAALRRSLRRLRVAAPARQCAQQLERFVGLGGAWGWPSWVFCHGDSWASHFTLSRRNVRREGRGAAVSEPSQLRRLWSAAVPYVRRGTRHHGGR